MTFQDFCAHTGWKLACASAQTQIFYNESENPIPIQTDPILEMETIHKTAKKNLLTANYILLAVLLLNEVMFISRLLNEPLGVLSNSANLFIGFCWTILLLMCICEICGYYLWRTKALKAAEQGEFLAAHTHRWLRQVFLGVIFLAFAVWVISNLITGSQIMRWIIITVYLLIGVCFFLTRGIMQILKAKKAPRNVNRIITIVVSFALDFALMGCLVFFTLSASSHGLFVSKDVETYEYNGMTWEVHQDDLPLTVEDLQNIYYEGYSKECRENTSLFLSQSAMYQHARFDAKDYKKMSSLEYTITRVNFPILYNFCKNGLLNSKKDEFFDGGEVFVDHYEPIDATPWSAMEAYQHHWSSGVLNNYLLFYPDRIIEIRFDWEPTPEQMKLVYEKLGQ